MLHISFWFMLMMLICWKKAHMHTHTHTHTHTIKKNTGALLVTSMKIGLEVNAKKTKHMLVS